MPCYVDKVIDHPFDHSKPAEPLRSVPGGRWCHLWADTEAELHTLAKRILVKREWFQPGKDFPHYDLTPHKRRQAILAGAVEASLKDWIRLRSNKEEWRYRYEERLGILCGKETPTPEQAAMAEQEANQWLDSVKIERAMQPEFVI